MWACPIGRLVDYVVAKTRATTCLAHLEMVYFYTMQLASFIISLAVAGILWGADMLTPDRWRKRVGWPVLIASILVGSLGTYMYVSGPPIVVRITSAQRAALGTPYPYKPLIDPTSYQGLYENGFVLWIDGRFFELSLDRQYWTSFVDSFPASEARWFTRTTLRKDFPQCGDRLPIGGLAKAMRGAQKQYYAWLGCLQAENSSSTTTGVTIQQFSNGYVIEGVLNPPQSTYRNRIVLLNGGRWESEFMDSNGTFVINRLH